VVVNSPHNPTGSVMAADQLRELAKELPERSIPSHDLWAGGARQDIQQKKRIRPALGRDA
jgi:Aminotransferase class I and II